jgi:hypothetical protein
MTKRKRGGCLTAWLILIMVGNAFGGIIWLLIGEQYKLKPLEILLLVFISFAVSWFALVVLSWKKWGFYGILAAMVIITALNATSGAPLVNILAEVARNLASVAILFALLRPVWKNMN